MKKGDKIRSRYEWDTTGIVIDAPNDIGRMLVKIDGGPVIATSIDRWGLRTDSDGVAGGGVRK